MELQTIGDLRLVIYISADELERRGFPPGELGLREVLLLTREVCRHSGVSLGRMAEIEAYPEQRGLLIFVQLERAEQEWFCFETLPLALDALQALRQRPEGVLAWDGTAYCLSAAGGEQRLALAEFGRAAGRERSAALEQDGALILNRSALTALWRRLRGDAEPL